MKDLATQAYINYITKMNEALEALRVEQHNLITMLERQVVDLQQQVEIYRSSHEKVKQFIGKQTPQQE